MSIFTGAGVAIVTPMKANGDVNYEQLEILVEEQVQGGTDAIIVCGTTGEASTLTHEEHLETIGCAVAAAKGRIPVVAGTGSNCTNTAVFLSKEAEKKGADGILVVTPYYNKATQKGLINHFTAIAKSVEIPMIMYNIAGRTGINMTALTAATLYKEVDTIVGMKEASGNVSQVAEMMHLTNGGLDMYSGNDSEIVPLLSLGGKGVISVLSNIAPRQTHDIVAKYLAGDTAGSLQMQLDVLPLVNQLFCEVNPIPVKMALNLMGKEAGPLRMPLTELDESCIPALREAMVAYGLEVVK